MQRLTYSYVVIGELVAWIVGWSLILEYSLVVSAVAVGWSGYAAGFMASIGAALPDALVQGPELGGFLNLPAIFIIAVVAGLLIYGTRESATLNAVLVVVKVVALVVFVAVALPYFDPANFEPFSPYGFPRTSARRRRARLMRRRRISRLIRLRRARHGRRGGEESGPGTRDGIVARYRLVSSKAVAAPRSASPYYALRQQPGRWR